MTPAITTALISSALSLGPAHFASTWPGFKSNPVLAPVLHSSSQWLQEVCTTCKSGQNLTPNEEAEGGMRRAERCCQSRLKPCRTNSMLEKKSPATYRGPRRIPQIALHCLCMPTPSEPCWQPLGCTVCQYFRYLCLPAPPCTFTMGCPFPPTWLCWIATGELSRVQCSKRGLERGYCIEFSIIY